MHTSRLSINLATVRQQWNLREAVEACARLGIAAVDPWRFLLLRPHPNHGTLREHASHSMCQECDMDTPLRHDTA